MRNKTLYSVCSMLQNSDFRAYIEFCLRAKNEIRNELSQAEEKNLQLELSSGLSSAQLNSLVLSAIYFVYK